MYGQNYLLKISHCQDPGLWRFNSQTVAFCVCFSGVVSPPGAEEAKVLFEWEKGNRENKEIEWQRGRIDCV